MEFGVLGPIEASSGGVPLDLGRTKQRALLARLLISANQVVSADRLLDDLWAGQPPADGPAALQIQVSRLRRALAAGGDDGQRVLETRKPGYVLRVADGALDASRFAALVADGRRARAEGDPGRARQRLGAALELWRGPALVEFADDEFARAEAARLEELRLVALEERVEAELELGAADALVGHLRLLVGEHPARERLWGQLMLALYRSGRQTEALRAYGEVRRWLGEELGIEPSAGLRDIEEAMLLQKPHLDWVAPAAAAGERAHGPDGAGSPLAAERAVSTLLGRGEPLERLVVAWKAAAAGSGPALALVAGEPGVGKTRLVAELADGADAEGALVLLGRCDEELAVPYQPLADALAPVVAALPAERVRSWLGGRAGELARLLPQLAEVLPDLPPPLRSDPETEAFRLYEAVTAALAALAGPTPVLLVLDDLHWAARPTLVLLRHLLRRGGPMRLLVVGTYRDTEPGGVPEVLGGLARDVGLVEVALRGLDQPQVGELVASLTGRPLTPAEVTVSTALLAGTAGNPLFVREVVRDLLERGGAVDGLGPPAGVQAVVRRRLARLSEPANQLLGTAAVIGPEFELAVLGPCSSLDEEALLGGLEEAMGAGLVGEVPGLPLRQRFTHALVREALYEDLPAARRAALHGRVGAALERVHADRRPEHLPELARHFGRAGTGEAAAKAIAYSQQAGDRALTQLADDEAVRHYQEALRLAEAFGRPDAAERADLLLGLGAAQRRQGDPRHRQTLLDAARLAARLDDPERMAKAALAGSRGFWSASGTVDGERVAALEAALARGGDAATSQRARLLAHLAVELVWAGDLARVRHLSDEALTMARSHGDLPTLAAVLAPRYNAIRGDPGTLAERLDNTAELLAVAEQLADPSLRCEAWGWRAVAAMEAADLDEATRCFATFDRLAGELRQPTLLWYSAYLRASRQLLVGRFAEAERSALEAFHLGHAAGHPDAEMFLLAQGLQLAFERGHLDAFEGGLRDAIERQPGSDLFLRSWQALLLCELDRDDEARACFEVLAARDFADLAFEPVWLHIVANCADVCAHLGDGRRAALLVDLLRPYEDQLVTMCSLAYSGTATLHLGRLFTAMGDLEHAEDQLARAVATDERLGAPAWAARSRVALAEARLARGAPAAGVTDLLRHAAADAGAVGAATVERRALALLDGMDARA